MKGIAVLNFIDDNENLFCDYSLDLTNFEEYDYCLNISESSSKTYSEIFNLLNLRKRINENLMLNKNIYFNFNEISDFVNNNDYFLKNINTIEFLGNCYDKISNFITNNNELLNYKILISEKIIPNSENLEKAKKFFGKFPNILFNLIGNDEYVNLTQFDATVNAINSIVNSIKRYDYSPAEQLLYAYDLIRNREYIMEEKSEPCYISRDLTSVLSGDKIVCLGYSNIFNAVINNLGISGTICFLKNNSKNGQGHARNLVYVKDEKYGIEGFYFFDLTLDRKINSDSNLFFNVFRGFAKTKSQIDAIDNYKFNDKLTELLKNDVLFDLSENFKLNNYSAILNCFLEYEQNNINTLSQLVDGKKIIDSENFLLIMLSKNDSNNKIVAEDLLRYDKLCDNKIPFSKFLKIYYNVRKNEYYEYPSLYPFSVKDIMYMAVNSSFELPKTDEEKLIYLIFGEDRETVMRQIIRETQKIITEDEIDRKIKGVQLAKTLSKVYEKKINKN